MPPDGLPPGPQYPQPVQLVGWLKRPGPFLERCRDRYGDTFTLRIVRGLSSVVVSHPDDIRTVFQGDPRVFHAGEANRVLRPILGPHSVLLLDEDAHMEQRKLLLPPFHGERMRRYAELMRDIAEREIATWPEGEELRLWPRMQRLTLEIIVRAIFGVDAGPRAERFARLLTDAARWFSHPSRLLASALLGPERIESLAVVRRARAPVDAAIFDEIRRHRADPGLLERQDIMSLLLQATHEDGSPMTDDEVRDELVTLLVAGHETTATSLAWAVERLLRHPDRWERLRAEAEAGGEYADAVIKETLRLRPVIPMVGRRLKQPAEIAGHRLPAGVNVLPSVYLVHRREDVYPEPRAFRPERFLEQPAGTYTWIPFGGGVRRCLGASFAQFEMKIVLGAIARHARLRPAAPDPEPIRRRSITLVPGDGARVRVAKAA